MGLGSIGTKHVHNLVKILQRRNIAFQIDALRNSAKKLDTQLESVIHKQYRSIEDIPNDYDIIFITNPTSLHYDSIKSVINKTKHMFIEKPITENCKYNIDILEWKPNHTYYVACPIRHKRIMKYIKNVLLKKETILSARIICSSYLPNWRKNMDYRNSYSSKKSMGGGVAKDLIHEWDYAISLFGKPKKVLCLRDKLSDLEIDCEDLCIYIAKYDHMLLEMHLDYFGHKTERLLQLFTNTKRLDIDLLDNKIYEYNNNILCDITEFEQEDFYLNEMEYFLDCVLGFRKNINTVNHAFETLKIALPEET